MKQLPNISMRESAQPSRAIDVRDPDQRRRDFDRHTVRTLVGLNRRGALPEPILVALLAAIGLPIDESDGQ